MMMYFKDSKALARSDQVMSLYNQICIDNSYRINLDEIHNPIELINLSWVLAICSLGHLEFKDVALISLEKSIYRQLMKIIAASDFEIQKKLKPKYFNELDPLALTVTDRLSYILPPDAVIFLLSNDKKFSKLCTNFKIDNHFSNIDDIKNE